METETRCVELKLISCKDITSFNFFQKLTLYVLFFIESDDPKRDLTEDQRQRQRTPTDRDADGDGTHPEWNHLARFDLGFLSPDSAHQDLFLRFEFRHDGLILGDKLIGQTRVPLAHLIRDAAPSFVSYEVRSAEGKPNGIFNFSYKVTGIGTHSSQILQATISPNQVPYPTSEIGNACCYPTVALPVYSSAVSPPPVFPSLDGEYHCYYQPPPPPPVVYPYPPPAWHVYPPYGPQAHPWPPGPYF